MKISTPLLCSVLLFASLAHAQGLIVNEFSNGPSGGIQEYFEFVVIGSAAAPLANVNLSGWIIDDNNGSFEGGTGTGVATGHFKITSGCYTSVPPGSVLVIYNANDRNALIPADDPTDSNGDHVYIIPHTNSCIQVNTATPTTSSTSYSTGTYAATTLTGTSSWTAVSLANGGDVAQVRKPDNSFYHGFAYGDVSTPAPVFPAALGGSTSGNIATGSGSAMDYVLGCGNFTTTGTYTRTGAASGTPGAANNSNNDVMIQNIRNGLFDYSNLANPNNCILQLLPLTAFSLEARVLSTCTLLTTSLPDQTDFHTLTMERSEDGAHYQNIASYPLTQSPSGQDLEYRDYAPAGHWYYRALLTGINGTELYSPVQEISRTDLTAGGLQAYISGGMLYLTFSVPPPAHTPVRVLDMCAKECLRWDSQPDQTTFSVDIQSLPPGLYLIQSWEACARVVKE